MLKYSEKTMVVLGDLEPPFNRNFKKGDVVLIEYIYLENRHDEHYGVKKDDDVWWVIDSEIDHLATDKYNSNLK